MARNPEHKKKKKQRKKTKEKKKKNNLLECVFVLPFWCVLRIVLSVPCVLYVCK